MVAADYFKRYLVEACMFRLFSHLKLNKFCLSALLLLVSQPTLALDPKRAITQYVHRIWQTKDGLPVNTIRNVTQSADGYLWLATDEGVVRFDGARFVTFGPESTPAIAKGIFTVAATRGGDLWIGTFRDGAIRLRNNQIESFTTENGLVSNSVRAIYEARDGSIWFGTQSGGVSRLKDNVFTNFTNNRLVGNSSWAFAETNDGSLWIGTSDNLIRYKKGSLTSFDVADGMIAGKSIRALCVDQDDRLWIGGKNGLSVWHNGAFNNYAKQVNLKESRVYDIHEDNHGNIWIGTYGGGITRFRNGISTTFSAEQGLSNDVIMALFEDNEGSLWVATESGGLNQFHDGSITPLSVREGLVDNSVWSILESQNGDLWFGTDGGLSRLRNGEFRNFTTENGLPVKSPWSLRETRDGMLWIGSRSHGLTRLQNSDRFQPVELPLQIFDGVVRAIYEDRLGNLWFATAGDGLLRWRNNEKKLFTVEDGLANDNVYTLLETRDGTLWIGTHKGLQQFSNDKFLTFSQLDGLPSDWIRALHEDADGALWIGTDKGLARLKNKQITAFTTRDGLFHDALHAILSDDAGNLWVSCNTGIFRVSKSELEQFERGEIRKFKSIVYGVSDGMKSREANGGLQPAGWRSRDGKLWFATAAGAVMIDPSNLRENHLPLNVIIEEIAFDQKTQQAVEKLNVPADINRVEFRFSAPNFRAPEKLKFEYQLVGYDDNWHEAESSQRQIAYTNLPPGNYTFRVKADGNSSAAQNEAGTSLAFYVEPRFYQTIWFYLLCAGAATGVGFLLYNWRLQQVKSRFAMVLAERTRIAREIHDTLAQGFVGTTLQLEAAEAMFDAAPEQAKEHLAQAKTLAKRSLSEARRTIWELRHESETNFNLAAELEKFVARAVAKMSVTATFRIVGTERKLPGAVAENLYRIVQEAFINALKHSRAKRVEVELHFEPHDVFIVVTDNGKGFDAARNVGNETDTNGSFGMVGAIERARLINAELKTESQVGVGTTVKVQVRIDESK